MTTFEYSLCLESILARRTPPPLHWGHSRRSGTTWTSRQLPLKCHLRLPYRCLASQEYVQACFSTSCTPSNCPGLKKNRTIPTRGLPSMSISQQLESETKVTSRIDKWKWDAEMRSCGVSPERLICLYRVGTQLQNWAECGRRSLQDPTYLWLQ
jgi:hypothetical protein